MARLPRPIWYILSVVMVAALLWHWHHSRVDAAFDAGASAQAASDRQQVSAATAAAIAAQTALRTRLAARQAEVSKGTDHALLARNTDLARRYDDLRLRWAAHRSFEGGAGADGATAVSATTAVAVATACTAAGWVSFDTAAAAALAADTAIARDDAWREWVAAQAAAWPQ
ncbi:MAG: hypothetical protein ACOYLS_16530 [Polymorphobacter sp.]